MSSAGFGPAVRENLANRRGRVKAGGKAAEDRPVRRDQRLRAPTGSRIMNA